jgi:hypothetical protein
MKYLFLVSMMVLSLACNKNDDKKGGGTEKPKDTDQVTDLSVCRGPAQAGAKITANPWKITHLEDDILVAERMVFTATSVTWSATCSKSGKGTTTATITVAANVTESLIQVLSDGENTTQGDLGDGATLNCSLKLQKGMQSNYSFTGPCLTLGNGANFVPAQ